MSGEQSEGSCRESAALQGNHLQCSKRSILSHVSDLFAFRLD
ncbi:hypothetical protein ACPS01_18035 [Priestia aryabhattai]